MNSKHYIGWKLEEARQTLAGEESTRALPVRVVETAAPRRKIDDGMARFGDWRVLRARVIQGEIELIVAREQIVD